MTNSNPITLSPNPLGLRAFEQLRAEDESEWLPFVFVPPPDFEMMASTNSTVIFGDSGAGKTALRQALTRQLSDGDKPLYLIADWQPVLFDTIANGTSAVQDWLRNAFDACASALLDYLGKWPSTVKSAKPFARDTLAWFLRQYLRGDIQTHLSRLELDYSADSLTVLRELLNYEPPVVLNPGASPARVIATLTDTLIRQMGLKGIWLFIDDLEPWMAIDRVRLGQLLTDLLSTLALFETRGFTFKILAPAQLEAALSAATGINRRRIDPAYLTWTIPHLRRLCEARLSAALARPGFQLDQLAKPAQLMAWLQRLGGLSPRAWLEMLRPVVQSYLSNTPLRPLTLAELKAAQKRYVPPLHVDLETGKVYRGDSEVSAIPPAAFGLLRYLYQYRHRPCSRSELYFLGHRQLDHEPKSPQDNHWEHASNWGRIIDTNLWRLREKIEPEPKQPIYLLSETIKGVNCIVLRHVW